MSSYFSREPEGEGEERRIQLRWEGRDLPWWSGAGIFARDRLDPGSELLLRCSADHDAARLLDLGCGHGVLGVLHLLRQGHGRALLVDVNPRACRAAARNLRAHGVGGLVLQDDAAASVPDAWADLVLTNPPIRAGMEVLDHIWAAAARCLAPSGALLFVGRPKQGGRRLAARAARALDGRAEKLARNKGFEVFRVTRT